MGSSAQLLADAVRDSAPLSLAPFFADMRAALEAAAPPEGIINPQAVRRLPLEIQGLY